MYALGSTQLALLGLTTRLTTDGCIGFGNGFRSDWFRLDWIGFVWIGLVSFGLDWIGFSHLVPN